MGKSKHMTHTGPKYQSNSSQRQSNYNKVKMQRILDFVNFQLQHCHTFSV